MSSEEMNLVIKQRTEEIKQQIDAYYQGSQLSDTLKSKPQHFPKSSSSATSEDFTLERVDPDDRPIRPS